MAALDDRVAVVAGASRGMGRGIAVELAAAGALVYVTGRTLERGAGVLSSLQDTVAEVERVGGRAVAVRCDHFDDAQTAAVFERVRAEQGRLDVLVNSVFDSSVIGRTMGKPFWELGPSDWREIVDRGTRTAYVASVCAAPLIVSTGPGGVIVNVSARGAQRYKYNVLYGAGKAALDTMTRDMAEDLRDHGVAVVSIWPLTALTESLRAKPDVVNATYGGPEKLQSTRYSGRAVVALASDPHVMQRSGGHFWVAELGRDYGFTDLNGEVREVPDLYGTLERPDGIDKPYLVEH